MLFNIYTFAPYLYHRTKECGGGVEKPLQIQNPGQIQGFSSLFTPFYERPLTAGSAPITPSPSLSIAGDALVERYPGDGVETPTGLEELRRYQESHTPRSLAGWLDSFKEPRPRRSVWASQTSRPL